MGAIVKSLFSLLVLLSLAAAPVVQPSAAEASAPEPRTALRISGADAAGRHVVHAIITDTATGALIARQKMVVKAGHPATHESGGEGGQMLRLAVTIEANGQEANYRTEFLRHGEVFTRESGRIQVDGGA